MKKYLLLIVSLFTVIGLVGSTGIASAASASTCGSGFNSASTLRLYHTVTAPDGSWTQSTPGPAVQKLFVKKISDGWRWCLITEHTGAAVGKKAYTVAGLKYYRGDGFQSIDKNDYEYFAGPVYLNTKKKQATAYSKLNFNQKTYRQISHHNL